MEEKTLRTLMTIIIGTAVLLVAIGLIVYFTKGIKTEANPFATLITFLTKWLVGF